MAMSDKDIQIDQAAELAVHAMATKGEIGVVIAVDLPTQKALQDTVPDALREIKESTRARNMLASRDLTDAPDGRDALDRAVPATVLSDNIQSLDAEDAIEAAIAATIVQSDISLVRRRTEFDVEDRANPSTFDVEDFFVVEAAEAAIGVPRDDVVAAAAATTMARAGAAARHPMDDAVGVDDWIGARRAGASADAVDEVHADVAVPVSNAGALVHGATSRTALQATFDLSSFRAVGVARVSVAKMAEAAMIDASKPRQEIDATRDDIENGVGDSNWDVWAGVAPVPDLDETHPWDGLLKQGSRQAAQVADEYVADMADLVLRGQRKLAHESEDAAEAIAALAGTEERVPILSTVVDTTQLSVEGLTYDAVRGGTFQGRPLEAVRAASDALDPEETER